MSFIQWLKRIIVSFVLIIYCICPVMGMIDPAAQSQAVNRVKVQSQELKGEKITLKTPMGMQSEFQDYNNMFSPVVRKALQIPEEWDFSSVISWELWMQGMMRAGRWLHYFVFDNTENKLIGMIQIRGKGDKDGQLGWWINENYWGGGRAQEALKLITKEYFKMHPAEMSYDAHVCLWNKRSYFGLRKFGFNETGAREGSYVLEYTKQAACA